MVGIGVIGCGRIGRMHAANIALHPQASPVMVYDAHQPAAAETAALTGSRVAPSAEALLGDAAVDGVLIASSTDTHVDLLVGAVRAGKPVLCEKPIDLDIDHVERCRQDIAGTSVPIMLGFNRRFDPTHAALRAGIEAGHVGAVELLLISSRDPGLPSVEYLKRSGGLFRDMTIHDFDMARFLLAEEPVEVFAQGSNRVDAAVEALGDIDTAMVTMTTASGALIHINNSRRAVYGYDQRIEAFGANGMLRSDNLRSQALIHDTAAATDIRPPLPNFFLDRYPESYRREIDHFVAVIRGESAPSVTFEDGRRALLLADAAITSLHDGRKVALPA